MSDLIIQAKTVIGVVDAFKVHAGERLSVHRISAFAKLTVESVRRAIAQLSTDNQIRSGTGKHAREYWLASDAEAERAGKSSGRSGQIAQTRTFKFVEMQPQYANSLLKPIIRAGAGEGAVPGIKINQSAYDRGY